MRSFLNAIKDFLILRRLQGGRLEGRTTVDAAGISISSQARKPGPASVMGTGLGRCDEIFGIAPPPPNESYEWVEAQEGRHGPVGRELDAHQVAAGRQLQSDAKKP